MKEIKFKGVVNGVEFDNVNDYNIAVTKAIEDGTLKSASSNTDAVYDLSEVAPCRCENCTCGENEECNCACHQKVNMLPGFDKTGDVNSYVDDYADNPDSIEQLKEYLADNLEKVTAKVSTMDDHSLEVYKGDLQDILFNIITEDKKLTTNFAKEAKAEIKKLREQLDMAYRALDVLNIWDDYYKAVLNVVNDHMSCSVSQEPTTEPAREADKEALAKETQDLQKAIEIFKKGLKDWCGIDIDNIDPNKPYKPF